MLRSFLLALACVAPVASLQLPQFSTRRAALAAGLSQLVPAAAIAAIPAQKGGFDYPVNDKNGNVYGDVVVNSNALSAAGGLAVGVGAIAGAMSFAMKPEGPEGCLISPTDEIEYCGVLNADDSCVYSPNAGWVCA